MALPCPALPSPALPRPALSRSVRCHRAMHHFYFCLSQTSFGAATCIVPRGLARCPASALAHYPTALMEAFWPLFIAQTKLLTLLSPPTPTPLRLGPETLAPGWRLTAP